MAEQELIGRANEENWEPETKAFELWSSAENVEEMQGTKRITFVVYINKIFKTSFSHCKI